jgi:hypothetical protein
MDPTTATGLGIGGIVAGVLAAVYTYLKHSKCKMHCCGKRVDFSMDLTPVEDPQPLSIKTPERKSVGGTDGSITRETDPTDHKGKATEEAKIREAD